MSESERRSYPIHLTVNLRVIHQVVIDSHYEEKHSSSISDELILALVQMLDGGVFEVEDQDGEFEYFATDPIRYQGKNYRLVWCLVKDCLYIGVVNAYRRP